MTTEPEVWKDIPSLPEYEASSHGRIMRKPHVKPMPHGGVRTYGGQPWCGAWESVEKRFIFQFRGKTYRVAKVIAEAFHGPAPFPRAVVMHIDEDSRNNVPSNLKWGTQQENLNAPGFIEYCKNRSGDNSPLAKWRRNRMNVGQALRDLESG